MSGMTDLVAGVGRTYMDSLVYESLNNLIIIITLQRIPYICTQMFQVWRYMYTSYFFNSNVNMCIGKNQITLHLTQWSVSCGLWAKFSPLPVFVYKVLLGESHAHSLPHC